MSDTDSLVSVTNLSKYYGDLPALRGLTFEVSQGEVFGVVGSPGAGKSTLLRILAGSLAYSSGQISVLGFDPMLEGSEVRRRVGLYPERLDSFEHVRVEGDSEFDPQKNDPKYKSLIGEAGVGWGLEESHGREILELSEFSRRRAILWEIWRHNPSLLLVDEPLKGLASRERSDFIQLLRAAFRRRGGVIASENIEDVGQLCSRVLVVSQGKPVCTLAVK